MFSPGFVSVSKSLPSWPILSAGTSVTVALVLSLFLTFEHLCAYHQPEVLFFPTLVWFKEFIRVWVAFILEFWLFRPVIFSHFTFWFNIYFCILQEQEFMIGLILMVPVYAVQSVSRQAAQLLLFFIPTFLHKKLPLCFLNLFTLHVIVVILKSENLNA